MRYIFRKSMVIIGCILCLSACSSKKDSTNTLHFDEEESVTTNVYTEGEITQKSPVSDETFQDDYEDAKKIYYEGDITSIVKVGDYSKLILKNPSLEPVTDEDVRMEALSIFDDLDVSTYEDKNATAQKGKILELRLYFMEEGKDPDQEDAKYRMGDGTVPNEIDKLLEGKIAGDTFDDINITYPVDGSIERIRGKAVTIHGEILAVRSFYNYTDASIKKMTGGEYLSITAYENHIRDTLQEDRETLRWEMLAVRVVEILEQISTFNEIPEALLDEYIERAEAVYQGYFDEEIESIAEEEMKLDLIMEYIAEEQDLQVTDWDYKESVNNMRKEMGITSPEEWDQYLEENGRDIVVRDALYRKVLNFIIDDAILV